MIGSDVWIGQNVTILHGITIGRVSVVAAGSVVTKDASRKTIKGGVTAREIQKRFHPQEINLNELYPGTSEKEERRKQDKPLDAILSPEDIQTPAFLKIDVQG